jgi:dipeptidyl aminopeptidase/acylaminoacyl peptidase
MPTIEILMRFTCRYYAASVLLLSCLSTTAVAEAPAAVPAVPTAVATSNAQQIALPKRPLAHTDFDAWRTIATPVLSRDGKWLAYSVQPQDGDGELVLRELATGKERREPVGILPPPATAPNEENPDAPPVPRAIRVAFSSDNQYLVASTFASKADTVAARKARKKPAELPKGGLLIMPLEGGQTQRIADVKSFQVPLKGGAWVAYLKEAKVEAPKTAPLKVDVAKADVAKVDVAKVDVAKPDEKAKPADLDDEDQTRPPRPAVTSSATPTDADTPKKEYGTELVLRNLANGAERQFADVLETAFARDGRTLLFNVASKAETDNGMYAVTPQDAAAAVPLLIGKGKYTKLAWNREQSQAVFLSDRDDAMADVKDRVTQFKVYQWMRGAALANVLVTPVFKGFPAGNVVSDKGVLAYSRDGKKLLVSATLPSKLPRKAEDLPTDDVKVVADLWRWNDDVVQPMQKVRATQDKNRSYRGVYDFAAATYTQLGSETLRNVSLSDDGLAAVGSDDSAYRKLVDYDGFYNDIYVVNPATGERKIALKKRLDSANISQNQWAPNGARVLLFVDKNWQVLDTKDGSMKNLSGALKVALQNEEHDLTTPAPAYGTAGWTSDSQSVLVYDRFDVWQLFVDGRTARNLTQGAGRKAALRLRLQPIEPIEEDNEERGIDVKKPLVLRGENLNTRATGFYRTNFEGTAPLQQLLAGDKNYRYLGRALEADVLLATASTFNTFPELHTTNANFTNLEKVTNVGAQMAAYTWGTGELMAFNSAKGVPLKAAVYKPENFDPRKKYPLMVYIYERLSQEVHSFVNPTPSNGINRALYVSNGYVVLMPDIAYTIGKPGQSAMDAVMPAIDKLVAQGFIDEKAIGIQGHSWGGYQIAWMVTQTNRFRAAEAGAPVGNMTSAYSGIRWGSGLPRQFQYEQQQSRIGKNLQEAPALYVENSPVFHAKKVKTPLLILHNDADDAVPWYQGIELFLALRRHEKEAYLFNYNGQLHNLRRRADQKDFALRMHQYFDHFLKGAAAPEWMTKGIAYNDRDEEKEKFGAAVAK